MNFKDRLNTEGALFVPVDFLIPSSIVTKLNNLAINESEEPVLIVGETGTGKEKVAEEIYRKSILRENFFGVLDCSTIPSTLLESALFGHVKGSFTGAVRDRKGLIELADNGTLFIDELLCLRHEEQSNLQRVIENGLFTRVGDETERKIKVRFIFSINMSEEKALLEGRLRDDLFYRISAITINLLPLRQRKDCLPELINNFLERFEPRIKVSDKAMAILQNYPWPGNIRELQNVMKAILSLMNKGQKIINKQDLPARLIKPQLIALDFKGSNKWTEFEKNYYFKLMEQVKGSITEAANISGLSRNTIYRGLKRYKIESKTFY